MSGKTKDFFDSNTFEESDFVKSPPEDVVAYNELRSCADILRMYQRKRLDIQPEFQRNVVWLPAAQSRFIDSLTKQLPIPSMCISLDNSTSKRQVIDGLQRISTIIKFLSDDNFKLSELEDIDPRLAGKTSRQIREQLLPLFEIVENATIPVTIIRCDYNKESHQEYLFTIFHRLNTGGTKLNNQEIRNGIYGGVFNDLLKNIVKSNYFMKLFNLKSDKRDNDRFKYEEIVLRFFALSENLNNYEGKLANFLNQFMSKKKKFPPSENECNQMFELVDSSAELIYKKFFDNKPIKNISATVFEALFVGVGANLDKLEALSAAGCQELYKKMLLESEFLPMNLQEGVAQKLKLVPRINKAKQILSGE